MMENETVQIVLKYAMMKYYQLRMEENWKCGNGNWCDQEESICHCWSGPAVNLLGWLTLLVSGEYKQGYTQVCQTVDHAVYVQLQYPNGGNSEIWLFPLFEKDKQKASPALMPLVCQYERKFHNTWRYAGYDALMAGDHNTGRLYSEISNRVKEDKLSTLLYFFYSVYITLYRRDEDEQEKQKILLTSLFLARPETCRWFCSTCLVGLKNRTPSWANQKVLKFLGSVLHDLTRSIYELLKVNYKLSCWDNIGYYKELTKEFNLPTDLTDAIHDLFVESCRELEGYIGLQFLWERIEDLWLPGKPLDEDMREAKRLLQQIRSIKYRNAARKNFD